MREIESVFIEGTWIGVGGNTPWISSIITSIQMDNNIIYVQFNDGTVLEIKSDKYMVSYKQE